MGLPDFLKFVARSAPSALYRLPKNVDTLVSAAFEFDYVLVDATNVSQTVGFDCVHALLTNPLISVRTAVIFALDAQRERAGTERFHRQAHTMVGDLDVKVQACCTKLVDAYKEKKEATKSDRPAPLVLMSGRHVAGEADYKLLDMHRHIVCNALASGTASPRVLFVSEDSDILCGALCGPAPQSVFIATNLRDTLFEVGILQVSHVVAYVALCIEALAEPAPPAEASAIVDNAMDEEHEHVHSAPEPPVADTPTAEAEATESKPVAQEDVVRRRKPDGPMVATGVRIALDDSSSDEDEPTPEPKAVPPASSPTATNNGSNNNKEVAAVPLTQSGDSAATASVSGLPPLDDPALPAAVMIHDSSVDFVFLFLTVMGNGANVPPLMRGSTKVDVGSCWQAYGAQKFAQTLGQEAELGKTLLQIDGRSARGSGDEDQAVVRLNCGFLRGILESLHYADAQSRPPAEEEKGRALAYLSSAVYATLRYTIGCNLTNGGALTETFLDTRPLSDVEVVAPSLAAVLWLLSQNQWRQFSYPLRGLTRRELVELRDLHSSDEATAGTVTSRRGQLGSGTGSSAADARARTGEQKRLQVDVGAALVAPPASSSSWAVRGAGSRTYTLAAVIATAEAAYKADAVHGAATTTVPATRGGASVSALLRTVAASLGKPASAPLCQILMEVWRATEAPAVSQFRAIAATATFVSPVTQTLVDGPLNRGKTRKGAKSLPLKAGVPMVYSFELRRMVPVAATPDESVPNADMPHAKPSVSTHTTEALRAALGLCLNYDKPPAPSDGAEQARAKPVKLPREAMDEDDLAEMNRLKKVARKEKERYNKALHAASGAKAGTSAKDKAKKTEGEGSAPPAAKRAKRPGKKERQRRQVELAGKGDASQTTSTEKTPAP